jgi:hypothetical protein
MRLFGVRRFDNPLEPEMLGIFAWAEFLCCDSATTSRSFEYHIESLDTEILFRSA